MREDIQCLTIPGWNGSARRWSFTQPMCKQLIVGVIKIVHYFGEPYGVEIWIWLYIHGCLVIFKRWKAYQIWRQQICFTFWKNASDIINSKIQIQWTGKEQSSGYKNNVRLIVLCPAVKCWPWRSPSVTFRLNLKSYAEDGWNRFDLYG